MTDITTTMPTRVGRQWVWADGTTLPVVAGGDGTEPAPEAPPAEPAPEAPPATEPAADAFEDEAVQQFDRAYVTKLRTEAAGHRTEAKAFKDAFSGYSDEERAVFLELATGLAGDPDTRLATAKRFQEIATAVLGNAPAAEPTPEDDAPMTKAQVQAYLAEQEAAKDQDRRVADIKTRATDLGYKVGSASYQTLLFLARENGGDMDKAHAAIKDEREADFAARIKALADEADGAVVPAGGGPAGSQTRKVTTIADASDALRERLAALRG